MPTARTNIKPGQYVWIRCDVKPGPFSDERMIRAKSSSSNAEWIGFSPVSALREPVMTGTTFIKGLILGVRDDRFDARLPGAPLAAALFEDKISAVELA